MEPLIRHLDKVGGSPRNNVGLPTSPRGFRVTNMMFADDRLIFAKVTNIAARNIAKVLNDFSHASG